MKIKGRGILSLCLLVFGGAAIYEYYSTEQKQANQMIESRLMQLNYDQVDRIDIQREKEKISLARSADGWVLQSPLQEPADSEATEQFVRDIFPERIIEVAVEGPQINWFQYGLAPAQTTITLTDAKGTQESFHISNKKNFEGNIFARRNEENRVLVLNPAWEEKAEKKVIDFRDRRVLKANIATVDELTVQNNQGSFTIHRVDGQWKVRGFNVDLDQNKVRLFLKQLADAKADQIEQASSFISGQTPLLQLAVKMGDKRWTAKVSQSKEDKKILHF